MSAHRLQSHQREVRRFYPSRGHLLTMANIRGPWRPSGAVNACGMFAVVWSTWAGDFWAPLHDFMPADQLRLIEACAQLDRDLGTSTRGRQ